MNSYYTEGELDALGLASRGKNVMVSRKASLYFTENITLGSNVRVDDFCILSARGGIKIEDYVHIGAYSALYGASGIEIGSYSGLSPRCTLFSESDDFSGESLTQPFFSRDYKPGYQAGKIIIEQFCNLGSGTTVMPGCHIFEGAATGAHSFVKGNLMRWWIYLGTPAHQLKKRSENVKQIISSRSLS